VKRFEFRLARVRDPRTGSLTEEAKVSAPKSVAAAHARWAAAVA
jgi:hypothetical protein